MNNKQYKEIIIIEEIIQDYNSKWNFFDSGKFESYFREKLKKSLIQTKENTLKEVREKVKGMILHREQKTGSEVVCNECGFFNDHIQCFCLYNNALINVLKSITNYRDEK